MPTPHFFSSSDSDDDHLGEEDDSELSPRLIAKQMLFTLLTTHQARGGTGGKLSKC
eukprot:EC783961.1.p3 GENE.EC783961.1~~EC783961.1.p3  ORF type:complete len:56 (+),score=12.75 EC783961.1:90-257(+)